MYRVLASDIRESTHFYSPVTFGAQRKITHPMARSISVSKIDSGNVVVVVGSFIHCLENFTNVNMYLNSTPPLKIVNYLRFTVVESE